MIAPAIAVPVMIAVPVVVVIETAAVAFPVAIVVADTIVTWADPASAGGRRPRPITPVPAIVMSDGIPIPFDPDVFRPRSRRHNIVARRRGSPDFNADADLGSGT